jgi:peptidyl-prolyl cis-trans isomerase SurA
VELSTYDSRAHRTLLGAVRACLAVILVAGVIGCGEQKPAPAEAPAPGAVPPSEMMWLRHILIQYAGATGAPAAVTRSKASADSLAKALRAQLDKGEDFEALAKKYSDDASAPEGGSMAPIEPGDNVPAEFQQAANALKPGEISPVVESALGFHIIQRKHVERLAAEHILIRYHGAKSCPDSLKRTKAQALAEAQKILKLVQGPDASFPVAAYTYSEDDMTRSGGGYVGAFIRGKMDPAFEQAAFALQEGQISGVVETPYGFHIIKRVKEETIRVSHVLVTWSGAEQPEGTKRTREEALQRALDVVFRARKGEDFAALAKEISDDKLTASKGGKLPPLTRGLTVPEFEEVAFSLKPGEVSDVVETKYGFHVLKRWY